MQSDGSLSRLARVYCVETYAWKQYNEHHHKTGTSGKRDKNVWRFLHGEHLPFIGIPLYHSVSFYTIVIFEGGDIGRRSGLFPRTTLADRPGKSRLPASVAKHIGAARVAEVVEVHGAFGYDGADRATVEAQYLDVHRNLVGIIDRVGGIGRRQWHDKAVDIDRRAAMRQQLQHVLLDGRVCKQGDRHRFGAIVGVLKGQILVEAAQRVAFRERVYGMAGWASLAHDVGDT